jgi:hypothetical protein
MKVGGAKDFFRASVVVCAVSAVGIGGFYAVCRYFMGAPEADFTTAAITLREFYDRGGRGDLPSAATNVFYARSHRGLSGFVDMYRFDAPLPECIEFGQRLLREHDRKPTETVELAALKSPPAPLGRRYIDTMGLSKVRWFDIDTIRSGYLGHRDASADPPRAKMGFWIDGDRGRFYYYSSD